MYILQSGFLPNKFLYENCKHRPSFTNSICKDCGAVFFNLFDNIIVLAAHKFFGWNILFCSAVA